MKIYILVLALVGSSAWGAEKAQPGKPPVKQKEKALKELRCEFVREVKYKNEMAPPRIDTIRLKALGNTKICMGWAKCVVNGITRFTQVACTSPQNSDCKSATQCFQEEGAFEDSRYEGGPQFRPNSPPVSEGTRSTGGAD